MIINSFKIKSAEQDWKQINLWFLHESYSYIYSVAVYKINAKQPKERNNSK